MSELASNGDVMKVDKPQQKQTKNAAAESALDADKMNVTHITGGNGNTLDGTSGVVASMIVEETNVSGDVTAIISSIPKILSSTTSATSSTTTISTTTTPSTTSSTPSYTSSVASTAKPIVIMVRPWSICPGMPPLAYHILDNRLLQIIHLAIEDLHAVIRRNEKPEKMKLTETKLDKAIHRMFMHARFTTKRSALQPRHQAMIDQNLSIFPQKPLLLNQPVRPLEFKVCSKDYVPKQPLMEANLPFTLPASILLHNLSEFVNHNRFWLWTYKLDGIRLYWIFMTVGEQKFAFWCNRKVRRNFNVLFITLLHFSVVKGLAYCDRRLECTR